MELFTIAAQLPSLNEYTNACRSNAYRGGKFKRNVEQTIQNAIMIAKLRKTLHKVTEPCYVMIEWHESTMRRDADNIHSSVKFILDALQSMDILPNDSRKYVRQIFQFVVPEKADKGAYCNVALCNMEEAQDVMYGWLTREEQAHGGKADEKQK